MILALDPGSITGWAVGDEIGIVDSGTWNIAPGKKDLPGIRYLNLLRNLDQIHLKYHAEMIVYEKSYQRSQIAGQYFHGFVATLQTWCARESIPTEIVYSNTLKKWATGDGHATKHQMVALGAERFNLPEADDNEIDALWLLEMKRKEVTLLIEHLRRWER